VTTCELVTAVTRAGGLGTFAAVGCPAPVLAGRLDAVRAAVADAPFAVNFLMPFLDRDAVAVASRRARLVECFYSPPEADLVELIHRGGALAGWQVGSVGEAQAAVAAGCDLVIAQGVEAGGHVRGTVGLLPLLDGVLAAVEVPVIAAGGISTAAGVRAVLAAGAAAARVGTAFVVATESGAHPDYVAALLAAGCEDTECTTVFGAGWPDAPHRVLRSAIAAAHGLDGETAGADGAGAMSSPVPRYSPSPPTVTTTGHVAAMALYAGQGVGAVTARRCAADILRSLTS
jgi:NAD(P)H-dependent flavin oxidoreductase YrpB (nitropropane dioxygenase family)